MSLFPHSSYFFTSIDIYVHEYFKNKLKMASSWQFVTVTSCIHSSISNNIYIFWLGTLDTLGHLWVELMWIDVWPVVVLRCLQAESGEELSPVSSDWLPDLSAGQRTSVCSSGSEDTPPSLITRQLSGSKYTYLIYIYIHTRLFACVMFYL